MEDAYARALTAYQQALDLADGEADPRLYGVILHDVADVHRAQGDLDGTARHYQEAADHKAAGGQPGRP